MAISKSFITRKRNEYISESFLQLCKLLKNNNLQVHLNQQIENDIRNVNWNVEPKCKALQLFLKYFNKT